MSTVIPSAPTRADETVPDKLHRLVRLAGTDEGFFILAVHSFVEYVFRRELNRYDRNESYKQLSIDYEKQVCAKWPVRWSPGRLLRDLTFQHDLANGVRHEFRPLGCEEAAVATQLLYRFCELARITIPPEVSRLLTHRAAWEDRRPLIDTRNELTLLKTAYEQMKSRNAEMIERMEEYREQLAQLSVLEGQIELLNRSIAQRDGRIEKSQEKIDGMRQERNVLDQERNELRRRISDYRDLETYLQYVSRFSLYTRTRADYERSLSRMTPEQKEAVDAVRPGHDFLVKGGAGTGKSLVLMEAMRRLLLSEQQELGIEEPRKALLLTYTRTLVKYDRYLAELMELADGKDLIRTADAFFGEKLALIRPGARIDFSIMKKLCAEIPALPEGMDEKEIATEIEEFILAGDVSREEYIEKSIARNGMKRPLVRKQREAVWTVFEEVCGEMDRQAVFSRNYALVRIIRHLEDQPEDPSMREFSHLFVDEAQDLPASALKALRMLAGRSVVLAGDADQSLYCPGSPFTRAGIDIRGRTRILRTNFRNTVQIHRAAEAFRRRTFGIDDEISPAAFREGPLPECYRGESARKLLPLLAKKALMFVRELGYEPANICVLAPSNNAAEQVIKALTAVGLDCADVGSDGFEFSDSDRVRISTLHSSKGLDFPVVLIYLPFLISASRYDDGSAERMMRNLLYVGMTRAMDNLNLFVKELDDPIVHDLIAAIAETEE